MKPATANPAADHPDVFRELGQMQERFRLLKRLLHRINSGIKLEQVIERTLEEAHKTFPEMRVSFSVIDSSGLTVQQCIAPPNMPDITGQRIEDRIASGLIRSLRQGEVVSIEDIARDDRIQRAHMPGQGSTSSSGARALLMVPMRRQDDFAVLTLASFTVHRWSEFETATLNDMAEFLTISLREAHMEERRQVAELHLRQVQKMEALGQLVGGLAHDFNNLMTAVEIYSGLLQATKLTLEQRSHIDEISRAGERGAALVKQLLALTRQQMLEPKLADLNQIVFELLDMMRRLIGDDIVLKLDLKEGLGKCRLDAGQMQQVLLNLAINARDAMPNGGTIHITTSCSVISGDGQGLAVSPSAGEYVLLSVADTGTGMDAETQARIFEPFFSTKPRGEGTGLGLATAFGIVKQHGGFLYVESALGHGTTFKIYLPCARIEDYGEVPENGTAESEERVIGVLLVEDNDIVRTSLVHSLKVHDFVVFEAARPEEALGLIERNQEKIDLLLTDLVMPGMTGRQLAERVKVLRPDLPVLYMSGYSDDPRTRELMGETVDFLQKPFSPTTLVRRIGEVLARQAKPARKNSGEGTKGELQ